MQMQLLLETPESPFQLLSSVFGEPKFFSNFVLLQQMYLQRKRYVYEVFHELAKWFLLRKDVFYPFFLFSKASVAVDFLFRKESYISILFFFLIVRYTPAIATNPKILNR